MSFFPSLTSITSCISLLWRYGLPSSEKGKETRPKCKNDIEQSIQDMFYKQVQAVTPLDSGSVGLVWKYMDSSWEAEKRMTNLLKGTTSYDEQGIKGLEEAVRNSSHLSINYSILVLPSEINYATSIFYRLRETGSLNALQTVTISRGRHFSRVDIGALVKDWKIYLRSDSGKCFNGRSFAFKMSAYSIWYLSTLVLGVTSWGCLTKPDRTLFATLFGGGCVLCGGFTFLASIASTVDLCENLKYISCSFYHNRYITKQGITLSNDDGNLMSRVDAMLCAQRSNPYFPR